MILYLKNNIYIQTYLRNTENFSKNCPYCVFLSKQFFSQRDSIVDLLNLITEQANSLSLSFDLVMHKGQ